MGAVNSLNKWLSSSFSSKKLYVFAFCLGIATFFWLLNALGKHFTSDISFEVVYVNQPEDRIVLNTLPNQFSVNAHASGFDLLSYHLRLNQKPIRVDLSTVSNISKSTSSVVSKTIATSVFYPFIAQQLGSNIEVKRVYPDSLHLELDERAEKQVKIIPLTDITFAKQYQQYGAIKINPMVTTISGPKTLISTMKYVYTNSLVINDLQTTVSKKVAIGNSYERKKITIEPNEATITIPVEKYTELTLKVPISHFNFPDGVSIKAIPNEVSLKCRLPLSKLSTINENDFLVGIDYNSIEGKDSERLKVLIHKQPLFVQSITITPKKVEYILKRNS